MPPGRDRALGAVTSRSRRVTSTTPRSIIRRCHLDLHPSCATESSGCRTDGSGRGARRLPRRLHLRRRAAAAVPDRVSRWPLSDPEHLLGHAAGRRKVGSAGFTSIPTRSHRPQMIRCTGPGPRTRTGTTCAPSATRPNLRRRATTWPTRTATRPPGRRSTSPARRATGPAPSTSPGPRRWRAARRRRRSTTWALTVRLEGSRARHVDHQPGDRKGNAPNGAGETSGVETCARCHSRRGAVLD